MQKSAVIANIRQYQRLLECENDPIKRETIARLLADAKARFHALRQRSQYPDHPFSFETINNRLIRSVSPATFERLKSSLEYQAMLAGDVMDCAGQSIEFIYFVNVGLISLVKTMEDGRSVEIGVIGPEGCSGLHALLGLNIAVFDAVVQISGSAFRIRRDTLRHLISTDEALNELLQKYAHFALAALTQTSACNRLHHLEQRLCRWLLIAHDSALANTFQLTQEYLATMLGSHRSGVSAAAGMLQKAGLIHYRYGHISVRDRAGLERMACECYGEMRAKLDRLLPRIQGCSGAMPYGEALRC